MKISIVNNHFQTKDLLSADLEIIFQAIKTGGKQKEQIELIRSLAASGSTSDTLKTEKAKLPAIMFNGIFKERNNESLISASGLMILDFDNVSDEYTETVKLKDYIFALFKSPTGKGYKVVIRIPLVKTDAEFKTYFYAIQKLIPQIDPSGKDIARLCYFSYDENILVKEFDEVKVWTEKIESLATPKSVGGKNYSMQTNWKKVATAMQMVSTSMVGNRHATMLKVGRLIGGYIASGEIDESESLTIIQNHIQVHSPEDYKDHIQAFMDGIEHGKKSPLSSTQIKEIDIEEKLGRIHLLLDDVIDKMDYIYENGMPKGYKLGWKELDESYTLLLGSTTYLYSAPYSGKSQWWHECLINLSKFYGMRHAVFSPETGDAAELFIELCRIYIQKDFTGEFKMSIQEKENAYSFVKKHFICIDGDVFDKELEVYDVCDYVTLLERKYNTKIHTLTIDPWNELKHNYGHEARDVYLETALKYVRKSAKNNDRHICLVTHVVDQEPVFVKKDNGESYTYYPIPTSRQVAGGQTWSRKGMMMIAIWRPIVLKKTTEEETIEVGGRMIKTNQLIVQIQKAKPKGYGKPAEINFYYDWKKHSYTDEYGMNGTHPEKQFMKIQTELLSDESQDQPF